MNRHSLEAALDDQRDTTREQLQAAWQLHVARVEEQLTGGWREHMERVVEERFAQLREQIDDAFTKDLELRLSEMSAVLRRDLAGWFNQTTRRLRQTESESDLYVVLLDAAGAFCRRAAFLLVKGPVAACQGSRDFGAEGSGQLSDTEVLLSSAPALLSAVTAKDTTVASCAGAEISPALAAFFGEDPDGKVALFPIAPREKTLAVLCTGGNAGGNIAGLEWLALTASVILEARTPAAQPALDVGSAPDWQDLLPHQREQHLRAQRFARVQVAEMRLYKSQAVRAGRARKDLYSALKEEIDTARNAFRAGFVDSTSPMPDYLHLELIRTLANDDAMLLGPGYPGPLA